MSAPATTTAPAGPTPAARSADDPVRGILLLLAAMASFSVSDAVAKHLSDALPAAEIVWLRWMGFTLLILPGIAVTRGGSLRSAAPGLQVLRSAGLIGSALFFVAGLAHLPLASATALNFISPLVVTALSIPLLGERIGPRRWAAVAAGLLGVLLIVRPGSGTFGSAALLPLLSAVSWAFALVITRKLSGLDSALGTMTYSALAGALVLTAVVPFDWVSPSPAQVGIAAGMAVASTAGQFLLVMAYRHAPASLLAPINYSQLVWAGLLGLLVFGSMPDAWTFLGAGIIIASGLYTAHRERASARARRSPGVNAP